MPISMEHLKKVIRKRRKEAKGIKNSEEDSELDKESNKQNTEFNNPINQNIETKANENKK